MNLTRPRLVSLDVFAGALLLTLGVACGSEVIADDDENGGSGGSGASGGSGGSGGAGASGAGTQNGGSPPDGGGPTGGAGDGGGCQNPEPVLINGSDSGLDSCDGGQLRRRAAIECSAPVVNPNDCCGGCADTEICSDDGEIACFCVPACKTDADCADGAVCLCSEAGGECTDAGCRTDDDCAGNEECTTWDTSQGCGFYAFSCTTTSDSCGGDLDCLEPALGYCLVQPDGHRECADGGCAIGRPFLVDEQARVAAVVSRADWCDASIRPNVHGLGPDVRAELAAAWTHTAQMEHASIAAFARFSLQLLSLGAPAELVDRTTRAMADETKHARIAFAMVSSYGGTRVGPAQLPIDGALDGMDLQTIIRLTVREGCVGETVAALEANETADHARDPQVKGVLDVIANDESAHAELAYRTVQWALTEFGDPVVQVLDEEIARLESELKASHNVRLALRDEELLTHGIATEAVRANYRRAAIRKAILPCLKAMIAHASSLRQAA